MVLAKDCFSKHVAEKGKAVVKKKRSAVDVNKCHRRDPNINFTPHLDLSEEPFNIRIMK